MGEAVPFSRLREYESDVIDEYYTNNVDLSSFTDCDWFKTFERFSSFDKLGFPTDESIYVYLVNNYTGLNRDCILVSPRNIGPEHSFMTLDNCFIDSRILMYLKWPISKSALKDKRMEDAWVSVTTNVITYCVKKGLPIAVTVPMYINIFLSVDTKILFKVHYRPSDEFIDEAISSNSRNDNRSIEELTEECDADKRQMSSMEYHYFLSDITSLSNNSRHSIYQITLNWPVLAVNGLVAVSDTDTAPDANERPYNWLSDANVPSHVDEYLSVIRLNGSERNRRQLETIYSPEAFRGVMRNFHRFDT